MEIHPAGEKYFFSARHFFGNLSLLDLAPSSHCTSSANKVVKPATVSVSARRCISQFSCDGFVALHGNQRKRSQGDCFPISWLFLNSHDKLVKEEKVRRPFTESFPPPQRILRGVKFQYLRRAVSCAPDLTPASYEVNYVQPFPGANT